MATRNIRYSGGYWAYGLLLTAGNSYVSKDLFDSDGTGGSSATNGGVFPVVTISSGRLNGNNIDGFILEVEWFQN